MVALESRNPPKNTSKTSGGKHSKPIRKFSRKQGKTELDGQVSNFLPPTHTQSPHFKKETHSVGTRMSPHTRKAESGTTKTASAPIKLSSTPHPIWYDIPLAAIPSSANSCSVKLLAELKTKSLELLDSLPSASSFMSSSDAAFLSTLLGSGSSGGGTSSDRLSALILATSQSPLHSTSYLNTLLSTCRKKNRDESCRAVRAVVDWLVHSGGLPPRKLRRFEDQDNISALVTLSLQFGLINHPKNDATFAPVAKSSKEGVHMGKSDVECILTVWAFEDWLKKWYLDFLKAIETLLQDPLPFVRSQQIPHLFLLLREKPEQEQNLLLLLCNKLGDTDKGVASKASHQLLQLLQVHPMMKKIVVREVANLVLLKPGRKPSAAEDAKVSSQSKARVHTQYYGVVTLNQVVLGRGDGDLANGLLQVYFELFDEVLDFYQGDIASDGEENPPSPRTKSKKAATVPLVCDTDNRFFAGVLSGIHRALPYSDLDSETITRHIDILFRVLHAGPLNMTIQALNLVFRLTNGSDDSITDRFYRALYDSLLDLRLECTSKQSMYLNLLFKAIKRDASSERVASFVKRLVQTLSWHSPTFVCGALILLCELFSTVDLKYMLNPTQQHEYDGRKREPRYAHAKTALWELVILLDHFHPSVAAMAAQLLYGNSRYLSGDLDGYTLSTFLDRLAFRNPKITVSQKGASMMQPGAGQDDTGMVTNKRGRSLRDGHLAGSVGFSKKQAKDVSVDMIYLHRFFKLRDGSSKREPESTRSEDESEFSDDSMGDEEQASGSEGEVWAAMKATLPGDDDLDESSDEGLSDVSFGADVGEGEESGQSGSEEGDDDEHDSNSQEDGALLEMLEADSDIIGSNDELDAPKADEGQSARKRRKLRHFPMFASADDPKLLALMNDGPEENI